MTTRDRHRPVRVLHVFGVLDRAGAELRTLDVMRELTASGAAEFHFCTLSGRAGALDAEIERLGGRVFPTPLGRGFARRFLALLREGRYDVVQSHVHYPSGLLLLLARAAGVPIRITHFRSTGDGLRPDVLRRCRDVALRALIHRCSTDILAVSEGAMTNAWRRDWRRDARCRTIYNGVALDIGGCSPVATRAALGVPPDAPLLLHVGRIETAKNHHRLLRIFRAVRDRRPDALLLIAGDLATPHADVVRAEAERLRVAPNVRWLGLRSDVPALLVAADVMVFPSLFEGLPGAVLEAAAAGLPVVGSDLPGIAEAARHLPSVTTLPLETEDGTWADTVLAAAATTRDERHAHACAFDGSPFTTGRSAKEMLDVYRARLGGVRIPRAS